MRKVIVPLAFVAVSSLVACSFQVRAGGGTNTPTSPPPAPPAKTAATHTAAPATTSTGPIKHLGKRPSGQATGPTPTPTSTTTQPLPIPTPPPSTTTPIVSAATIFGGATIDPTGYKGTIYWVDKTTTKLPALTSMKPAGFVFTKDLNVTAQSFPNGFPGVDATRREYFAIRYEAPLVVTTEADYDFRVVADDGAILQIDGTPIVDDDGVRAAPAEKSGPVHLIAGTHLITVDYLQTNGNVALQVFCKKANDTERVCPTQL